LKGLNPNQAIQKKINEKDKNLRLKAAVQWAQKQLAKVQGQQSAIDNQ
jgi:hypothetical protein